MTNEPLVVNLFGGPGAGKSTTASLIYGHLKSSGINCEYVQEFAKDLTWSESFKTLGHQLYILGQQAHRQWRLRDQVDVIVTDAPLLLSLHYGQNMSTAFKNVVRETFQDYRNHNWLIERGSFPYNPRGRSQTESEANAIQEDIRKMLDVEIPHQYYSMKRGADEAKILADYIIDII